MAFYTFTAKTNGVYTKAEDFLNGKTLVDGNKYAIQVLGGAMLSYDTTTPTTGFWINTPEVFTYEKVTGEDLYVMTSREFTGSTITIAGTFA